LRHEYKKEIIFPLIMPSNVVCRDKLCKTNSAAVR